MKENIRLKFDKSLRNSTQIDFSQYISIIFTYFSVIFENENFMKYESYSEQSAKNSKDEEFKRNDHDSFASLLSKINFEVFAVVNFFFFFFFFFFFSFDSDIIASDYDENFSLLSSSFRLYFRLLALILVFSLSFSSFRFYSRLQALRLSLHSERRLQRFCLLSNDWVKYLTRSESWSDV